MTDLVSVVRLVQRTYLPAGLLGLAGLVSGCAPYQPPALGVAYPLPAYTGPGYSPPPAFEYGGAYLPPRVNRSDLVPPPMLTPAEPKETPAPSAAGPGAAPAGGPEAGGEEAEEGSPGWWEMSWLIERWQREHGENH